MGKILKIEKFTTLMEVIIIVGVLGILSTAVYIFAPGIGVSESKTLNGLEISSDQLNNTMSGKILPLPTDNISQKVADKGVMKIGEYAWNGNSGMIVANGGPRTTEGSLMEAAGLNVQIIREDMVGGLRDMQVKFVEEYNSGKEYPEGDKSAFAVSIMGDGVPFYITTTQKVLDEKFGKGKYHVQVIGAYGLSYGEDKLIGPKIWQDNPQKLKGAVVSAVIGDGDWVVACNFAYSNKIPVNPDPTTYDAEAVNFVAAPNDDYIEAVKDLIKSQKTGYTIPLKEVSNGRLTGKTIEHKIDGAVTWTPGDKIAFDELAGFTDVVSTKDYINQMATSLVVVKEWALAHDKDIIALLKQTYIAANQIKLYDEWAVKAADCVAKTYGRDKDGNKLGEIAEGKYWYDMFKGEKGTKGGVDYNIGGTRVFNYADAKQYYGITDGNNRYKSVYEQVSKYLTELNPCNFNDDYKEGVVEYGDAVNMYFLNSISDINSGTAEKVDYSKNQNKVMADGKWNINFATGSTEIQGSESDLETIYNLLNQAENAKVKIIGHTDNTGNSNSNLVLSKGRANSVAEYLKGRGISKQQIDEVDGKGDTEPIADNKTNSGKAKNRRVDIILLK